MKFILGQKIGMSQYFTKEGQFIPVTLIECGPCYVLQKKSKEKDGYEAVQLGFKKITKKSKIKKSAKGKEYQYIRESRWQDHRGSSMPTKSSILDKVGTESGQKIASNEEHKIGDKIDVSIFKEGDVVKVSGISKGKGFQGAVKKWNFAGKSASHGVKHEHRTIGSIGGRFPQRVVPGKKMPGRMGGEKTTVKNLKIVKVDLENNLLIVKGAVPGRNGILLEVKE